MLRRAVVKAAALTVPCRQFTVNADVRDSLTKPLSSLKEECKGQNLDLADMADTMKGVAYKFQEASRKAAIEDKQFKGKTATLSASLKAYNTRLANLQNETRSMQAEVDALLKLLWGTERPDGARFTTPPPETKRTAPEDFEVEPPPLAKALGEEAPTPDPVEPATPAVERVEGERVSDRVNPTSASNTVKEEEIEVETIEVDVEPPAQEDPVETMKVTDITKELYEKGVNFSDCMDARSLRQRYRDVLSGKIPTSANASTAASRCSSSSAAAGYTAPLTENTSQPRMPQRSTQQQYQQPPPNNNPGNGLAYDPYPNAHRKMIDPMKYVREVKQELALEKGIDANSVDLWSGKVRLDDNKRLYDYPSIQSYPIEVRQKGDIPS
ncbi:putative mitochondrial hypothetical protein [Leptomonas pyrrhocoris]|uniref:Ubiquitin-like domain-containing protein n=1 Tax=Leptomonas pyrrhocoris TaxID=157538 RepID=A0A0M9FQU4_LEPPY|nr:putative mitochondrial hypothetical protein [Leptomonas pyrrhocoris]XP_015652489.1 putative mitochondrial hypothetical protein [Leptomonas pyrrhocoris]XP_015652490.1 putative mitochondrial hypothetical protein [Leptomonas pyrrhocoris]XP_015652491.1 putative mitochondrial hypothetical protein [Leptomonas pyrrhocoris]KPA74049.1 putative mitochondrial hypothetical protein [Leptomonas pyrrhocoris]KPA74050.1 putative mitochondrial hypothetical protein [Leptomonas pyrrhocoris]KPA74051.1 putative|eukprot:XP_015652488.1 putative mitochondrial hypothetical protein [Leptomonas pyrrhocoris]